MLNRRTKWTIFLLGSASLLAAASLRTCEFAKVASADHAVNRVWIERVPADERDMIAHFVMLRHPRGRVGAFGRSSQWRHLIEGFKWALEGERLILVLPQQQAKGELRVRTWACAGEAPKPFELCLELRSKDRAVTYYSRKDWIIEPRDVEGSLAELAATQPALAASLDVDVLAPSSLWMTTPLDMDAEWAEIDPLKFGAVLAE